MQIFGRCGIALVLAIGWVWPVGSFAQDAPAGGTVTGQVTCADTERPAKFADVKLFGVPDKVADAPKVKGKNGGESLAEEMSHLKLIETQTDALGGFVAKNVPPGDYYVFAWMPGYLEADTMLQMDFNAGVDLTKLIPGIPLLHVVDGRTTQANVSMERGAAISGQLVWDDGSPVTGAMVSVVPAKGKDKPLPEQFHLAGTGMARNGGATFGYSDDQGHFRLVGLAPGTYLVRAMLETQQHFAVHSGMQMFGEGGGSPLTVYAPEAFHRVDAKPVTLHDAEERSDVEIMFRLSNMYSVSGRVTSAVDGHGINSAMVRLTDAADKEFSRWAAVDASGNYTVTFMPPGTYDLDVGGAADRKQLATPLPARVFYIVNPALQSYESAKQAVVVTDGNVMGVNIALTPMKKSGSGAGTQ